MIDNSTHHKAMKNQVHKQFHITITDTLNKCLGPLTQMAPKITNLFETKS